MSRRRPVGFEPTANGRTALIAQLVERVLGKNEVSSSNLDEGSRKPTTGNVVRTPRPHQPGGQYPWRRRNLNGRSRT